MPPEEQHDLAAAELALGLLEGDERAAALRRLLAEPAFAADVAWWRDALAPMVAGLPEATPSAEVEVRIMAAVEGDEVTQALRWRAIAVALAACLVAAVALLAMLREPVVRIVRMPAGGAGLIATIQPSDGKGSVLAASYDVAGGEIRLSGAPEVPATRVAELWVIGKDGPPVSLGLLRRGAGRLVVLPSRRGLLTAGATLAVSVEPAGGSPTGLPTGPVVATGTLARV